MLRGDYMKKCNSCNQVLPLEKFNKNKHNKDGYENKCSKCRYEARKKYINTCENCGAKFKTARKQTKYCSPSCKPQNRKDRVIVNCSYCGKEKEVTKSHKNMYKDLYCNDKCKSEHYKILYSGLNSPHYKKDIIKCCVCGKEITRNLYEIEKYERHYCSVKCKAVGNSLFYSGENNPNYNPNLSEKDRESRRIIEGYKEWILSVYKKYNFTCACCGSSESGKLNAHHILNYHSHKDLRIDVDNGIALCEKCHMSFHMEYGYKNNNREQLIEFIEKYGNTVPSR